MLRASHRALRPGGRTAFHVIELPSGLDDRQRRRAVSIGPPAVAVRTSHESLLRSAGFVDVGAVDATAEYLDTQHRWLAATLRHEDEMRATLGDDTVDDGLERRRRTIDAIAEGLLVRTLYSARR